MTWRRALQSAGDTCTTELLRIAIAGLTNVALDQVTTAQNGLNSVDVGITANATHANWVVAYLNSAAFLPDLVASLATSSCADLGDYTSSTPTATQAVATISPPPPNPSPPPSPLPKSPPKPPPKPPLSPGQATSDAVEFGITLTGDVSATALAELMESVAETLHVNGQQARNMLRFQDQLSFYSHPREWSMGGERRVIKAVE